MKKRFSSPNADFRSNLYSALIIGAGNPWSTQNRLSSQPAGLVEPDAPIVAARAGPAELPDNQPST
jgi:hypothetical protein